jgi:hypothetical protein
LISWLSLKTKVDGFFQFDLKTGGFGFLGLDLKTDDDGLINWVSKSSQWFLGLGLKIKRATVCRLHHKTDGRMKMAWDTRRDVASCFV